MITDKIEEIKDTLEDTLLKEGLNTNLGKTERVLSIMSGTFIFLKGVGNVFSHPLIAAGELVLGFGLLQRGISGYCSIAEKFNEEQKGPDPILIVREEL